MFLLSRFKSLSEKRKMVIQNIFWASFGKVYRLLTVFIVGIFIARYLGPDQYGLMNYVISIVALFTIISNFGLDNIEIRELSKRQNDKGVLLGTSLTLRLFFSILAILLLLIVLSIAHTDKYTFTLIGIYSLSMAFNSLNVIRNYFTSILENKFIVISEIIRSTIGAGIKVILLIINASLEWFILALLFDSFILALGYFTAYKKKAVIPYKKWKFSKTIAIKYLKASFPLLLSGAAVIVYQKIDQVMIKNMIDNESVACFSIACNFTENILFIPLIMAQTMAPLLVRNLESDVNVYIQNRQRFVSLIVGVSILMSATISILAYPLVRYTFGIKYLNAVPVLQIMAFKAVGMALSNSSSQLIIIEGKQKWAVIRNIVGCLVCVIGNLLFIPDYGIIGSAWVTICTVLASGFLSNLFIKPYREIFYIQCKVGNYFFNFLISKIKKL